MERIFARSQRSTALHRAARGARRRRTGAAGGARSTCSTRRLGGLVGVARGRSSGRSVSPHDLLDARAGLARRPVSAASSSPRHCGTCDRADIVDSGRQRLHRARTIRCCPRACARSTRARGGRRRARARWPRQLATDPRQLGGRGRRALASWPTSPTRRDLPWRVAAARDSAARIALRPGGGRPLAERARHLARTGASPGRRPQPVTHARRLQLAAVDALGERQGTEPAAMSDRRSRTRLTDIDDATPCRRCFERGSSCRGEREGAARMGMRAHRRGGWRSTDRTCRPARVASAALKEKWLLLIGDGSMEEAGALAMSATRAAAGPQVD